MSTVLVCLIAFSRVCATSSSNVSSQGEEYVAGGGGSGMRYVVKN